MKTDVQIIQMYKNQQQKTRKVRMRKSQQKARKKLNDKTKQGGK